VKAPGSANKTTRLLSKISEVVRSTHSPSTRVLKVTSGTCSISVKCILLFSLDCNIAGGICHTGQNKSCGNLVIVKERLIGLIYSSREDFASTGRAGTCSAGVVKFHSCFFTCVKNVLIVFTGNHSFGAVGRDESNIESH